jgi:RIB43A
MRMNQIQAILEQASEEEKYMKKQQLEEMKRSWAATLEEKRNAPKDNYILRPEMCGPSSAQNFGGEDALRESRQHENKLMMREWVKEGLSLHEARRLAEKEEDAKYAAFLKTIDAIREEAEKEEADMKKTLRYAVREENLAVR